MIRHRLGVVSRALAAIAGGYGLAALVAAACALALPPPRGQATLTGVLLSFAVYAVAVMWVFAARSAARAWLGLLLAALPAGAVLLWKGALP